jgi:hypothetical protein
MRPPIVATVAAAAAVLGCAHWPENAPLTRHDPRAGYRLENVRRQNQSDDLLVFLAFSGGGTRAAALSYGVLEALARTEIAPAGAPRRLVDEVDVISAVSGGTFTATYFALRGDRIFVEVSFHAIPDARERRYFLNLPTSFELEAEQVDRLREIAGRILRDSPEFREVVAELGGKP